jgi:hypothetical protein
VSHYSTLVGEKSEEQRRIQAAKPKEERLYIGGEIEVHHLSHSGFAVYAYFRFPDYEHDEAASFQNFAECQTAS